MSIGSGLDNLYFEMFLAFFWNCTFRIASPTPPILVLSFCSTSLFIHSFIHSSNNTINKSLVDYWIDWKIFWIGRGIHRFNAASQPQSFKQTVQKGLHTS